MLLKDYREIFLILIFNKRYEPVGGNLCHFCKLAIGTKPFVEQTCTGYWASNFQPTLFISLRQDYHPDLRVIESVVVDFFQDFHIFAFQTTTVKTNAVVFLFYLLKRFLRSTEVYKVQSVVVISFI